MPCVEYTRYASAQMEVGNSEELVSHQTVRDLLSAVYRREQLRSAILNHDLLDATLEYAVLNKESYLHEFAGLPHVGRKAVAVLSEALHRAEQKNCNLGSEDQRRSDRQ